MVKDSSQNLHRPFMNTGPQCQQHTPLAEAAMKRFILIQ